eukprot:Phypoly_transcript_06512.p1 GENE.Phypoly_transcript_06512~~Phypoly_transcript_06512.p1  ORF type:complete len:541 (+),score=92.99 Phypoly_transcript_06512:100-1722(+)
MTTHSLYFSSSTTHFSGAPGSICTAPFRADNKEFHVETETSWKIQGKDKILLVPAVPAKDISSKDLNGCSFIEASIPPPLLHPLLKYHHPHESQAHGPQPAHATQPTRGSQPTHESQPAHATQPAQESQPTHGSQPAPMQGSQLTHGSQPAHSSHAAIAHGFHSGRRSGLVCIEGEWYRLKGCGDAENGITTKEVEDGSGKFSEIRGVMFENTSTREIYITQMVNSALQQYSMFSANEPLAYWKYETEWPVQCTCGIFKTYGDRRLNDHVLLGLETLLPFLVDESVVESIHAQFLAQRTSENEVLPTWLAAMDDTNNLIDLRAAQLREHSPNNITKLIQDFGDKELLEANFTILDEGLQRISVSLLPALYWRLGWEVGKILHIIHNAQISWGTYPDKLGMHCNAHPNNLVLLPPRTDTDNDSPDIYVPLLAPLDFDMAFTEKSVTSLAYVDTFRQLLDTEVRSMRLALAGDSELNTGTRGVALLPSAYLPLKWGLRDTLVRGFDTGYSSELNAKCEIIEYDMLFRAVLEFALVVSKDVVA